MPLGGSRKPLGRLFWECGFGGWPVLATFIENNGECNKNSQILYQQIYCSYLSCNWQDGVFGTNTGHYLQGFVDIIRLCSMQCLDFYVTHIWPNIQFFLSKVDICSLNNRCIQIFLTQSEHILLQHLTPSPHLLQSLLTYRQAPHAILTTLQSSPFIHFKANTMTGVTRHICV